MNQCSVIIPVYNKASLTRSCLDTLLDAPFAIPSPEIIVVDDGSTDTTQAILATYGTRIKVVKHTVNSGFATACNNGAALAKGKYLVFLNNDTLPHAGWLDALVRYIGAHPAAVMVGSKMLFPDNTIQHAGVVICQDRFPRHIYAGFPADHPAVNKSRRYQIVTAGCALMERKVFEQVGGFDTAFRNGYEDVDLCLRLGQRGHEIHYCHESVLYHLESVSEGRFNETEANTKLYVSRWKEQVQPDDLHYYFEDGLLRVSYETTFPVRFSISPLLGTLERNGRDHCADRLLDQRSRQTFDLLKDTIRLNVRALETELRAAGQKQMGADAPDLTCTTARPVSRAPQLLCEGAVHWRSNSPNACLISLIIPVKNGAAKLRKLLPRIFSQATRDRIEIVAIDSGSSDESVKLLREVDATVVNIDPLTFNHGLTRNLGVEYARGDFYVFLGQNTLPVDDNWLSSLVAPLNRDSQIAGVCSQVLPPEDADVLMRKDGIRELSGSCEAHVLAITNWEEYRALPHHALRALINFHTVSAAVRPAVFKQIPFRKVTTIGEDILWAKEVLEAGYKIQHEPSSRVMHGHHFNFVQLLQRNVDDGVANREIVGRCLEDQAVIPGILHWVRDDWRYLEKEANLEGDELEHWKMISVLRRTAQTVGQWIGVNHERMPGDLARILSSVRRSKSGSKAQQTSSFAGAF